MKPLVGEGKPFHSAVDKTAALLKRKSGTGAEFMKELMGVSGIKPTELQERGLTDIMGMPKMTHEQFMAELAKKPAPAVEEKVLGEGPDPRDVIRAANAHARTSALNYAESADTSREARQMKADELRRLRENHRPQMMEFARSEFEDTNPPHHETYTLPGGDNYREMLIKAPARINNQEKIMEMEAKARRIPMFNSTPEQQAELTNLFGQIKQLKQQEQEAKEFPGVPAHFGGEPGILASMRLKDRTGPNGEKLLHLEELQSDWHQQGRDKGYKTGKNYRQEFKDYQKELLDRYGIESEDRNWAGIISDLSGNATPEEMNKLYELKDLTETKKESVPDAPFKKNWEEMALKRLVHHAAEKGYHGIVVTPGEEQADRYNLATHINAVNYIPSEQRLIAKNHQGQVVLDKTYTKPEDLPEHIGKELTQKLLATEPTSQMHKTSESSAFAEPKPMHMLTGQDIKVGGEGMKGFYDKKVPNILNSIGKKYGVKTQLGGYKLPGDPSQRGDASERLGVAHVPLADMNPEQVQAFNQRLDDANAKHLHHFPITEEMRKDVLTNGLPLYSQGGKVHMADGGDMDTMQMELMNKRMATGGRAKVTKGYVTHEPKNPHPEVGTRFKATPQGNLAKMKAFDLMKQEGKGSIVPIPYDATTRDNLVTEVSGNKLINPLLTEAGFDYSLDPTHMAQDIGGASNSAIAKRVQDRVNQAHKEHKGDVFLAPNIMGEDAENFSHHPAHIVLDLMAQRQLNSNTLQALSDDLRGQVELKRNAKTGEVIKTYPYTKFLGYHHPKMMEQVIKGGHGLETTPGNLRKKIMERLGLVNMQKLLDYNLGDLKASILDPELATDPKAYMGRTFVKAKPGAALRPSKHTSYDTDYTGTNVGGLGANRPFEILMPDVTESIYSELKARPAKTVKTPAQMRAQVIGAIEKRKEKFAQPINARVINNAGLYEEGLKQGEFDPKNVDSVLAYFQRKGGYKKGGKIKKMAEGGLINYKNIGVNEAPDMGIKAYFPPAPRSQNSVLPFGGVEQAPPAPQQPQQNPAAPQGMPQGMPQGNMPMPPQGMPMGAPPAPPPPAGNMLQMTRQGQALNAMAPAPRMAPPPKMASGGQVDRDTMMLSLMNRNKR